MIFVKKFEILVPIVFVENQIGLTLLLLYWECPVSPIKLGILQFGFHCSNEKEKKKNNQKRKKNSTQFFQKFSLPLKMSFSSLGIEKISTQIFRVEMNIDMKEKKMNLS